MKVIGVLLVIFLSQKVSGQQMAPANIPISCEDNSQCQLNDIETDAFCSNGYCKCRNGSTIVNCTISELALSESKPSISLIGRPCKQQVECQKLKNGMCNTTNNQCNCQRNFISSSDNNSCLPLITTIGGKCEDVKQCSTLLNTTCSQSQCICQAGFHNRANRCVKSVGFGETCENTDECSHVLLAVCNEEKICACPATMYQSADGKSCISSVRQLEAECTTSAQCIERLEHAVCASNHCQCIAAAHYVATYDRCIIHKGLNESCSEDYECIYDESGIMDHVKCQGKMCKCIEGFVEEGKKCVNTGTIHNVSAGLMIIIISYFVVGSTLE